MTKSHDKIWQYLVNLNVVQAAIVAGAHHHCHVRQLPRLPHSCCQLWQGSLGRGRWRLGRAPSRLGQQAGGWELGQGKSREGVQLARLAVRHALAWMGKGVTKGDKGWQRMIKGDKG